MIPYKLHYCWFGSTEPPLIVKDCIESWKRVMPNIDIILWNESNVNIEGNKFMREAYLHKKYAFVSDYARYMILNKEGGIFLDSDVELIKPLDELLNNQTNFFVGFEKAVKSNIFYVNPGLIMASIPGHPILSDILKIYDNINFTLENGKPNIQQTSPIILTKYLVEKFNLQVNNMFQDLKENVKVYPSEYFSPINPRYFGKKKLTTTKNTYSIHRGIASWVPPTDKIKTYFSIILHRIFNI